MSDGHTCIVIITLSIVLNCTIIHSGTRGISCLFEQI